MHTVFRPAHDLAAVVDPAGVAVITARKWRQCRDGAVHLAEAAADLPARGTRCIERPARECFAGRIIFGRIGDPDDDSVGALHGHKDGVHVDLAHAR